MKRALHVGMMPTKKTKLIVTGTSKLLEDVKALEQLEDIRVLIEKLENKKILWVY